MKFKQLWDLFLTFLKFGCFTFGGGWSIVAQMKKEYVDKRKTLTEIELLDMTTVGRSLPGTMIGNAAMLFGYREAGFLGGVACILGMIIPPILIIVLITILYTQFQSSEIVVAIMKGIRAAVVPIVIYSVYGIVKSAFKFPPCYIVAILTFVLLFFFNVNVIYLILIGLVLGFVISEYYERRRNG